ncbi:unnamed protein product [Bodo saltans]|uniref:Uncharacterized protein n=1 Tax=Bodo saltans TaxID=75058 RepID=A0A0S4JF37_BODSA|nr:unnamed protein product [Bodo saltans]|eukprot:CUG90010.1 unnamed protein product [Bodo saltans]
MRLVAVVVGLEGTINGAVDVGGLGGSQLRELGAELAKVQRGNLLVELLGQEVHVGLLTAGVLAVVTVRPDLHLSQDLVAEGVRHDEGRVTVGAAKVDEAALGEQDDVAAGGHGVAVNLGLDLAVGNGVGLQPADLDLSVEVANVADDGVVAHEGEVLGGDDVVVTGGGHEDVGISNGVLNAEHLVALHARLQGVDGVDLGDHNAGTEGAECSGASLTHITVAGDDRGLAGNHHVSGALDAVHKGLAAAVQVVELALRDAVVDVDRGQSQAASLEALVQGLHASRGLLSDTEDLLHHLGVLVEDQVGEVTTVIEDHVGQAVAAEALDGLDDAPVVLLVGLTLPGEHGNAGLGDRGGSVVLGGEDVARRPAELSAEGHEGLHQHGGLHGHVQATGDLGASQGLGRTKLAAQLHQTGHLVLGQLEGLASPLSEADITNLVVSHWCVSTCMTKEVEGMGDAQSQADDTNVES